MLKGQKTSSEVALNKDDERLQKRENCGNQIDARKSKFYVLNEMHVIK